MLKSVVRSAIRGAALTGLQDRGLAPASRSKIGRVQFDITSHGTLGDLCSKDIWMTYVTIVTI